MSEGKGKRWEREKIGRQRKVDKNFQSEREREREMASCVE